MRKAGFLAAVVAAALAALAVTGVFTDRSTTADAQTGAAPTTTTGDASVVTSQSAKVSGTVNPHGTATTYTFQFGPTSAYGAQTTPASAGSGTTASAVNATLTGLAPGTTYHYRLVARNTNDQTTSGVDRTFTTQPRSSRLGLFGHTAFVGPGRQVGVFTGCFGDRSCRGSLRMTSNGATIGKRSFFFIRRNGGGIIHVPLNSRGRKLASSSHHFRTQVTVSSTQSGSDSKSVTVVPYN